MLYVGMHPRVLVDGFDIAKRATLEFLEKFKTPVVIGDEPDKEILKMVGRTTLRTKVLVLFFYFIPPFLLLHSRMLYFDTKLSCLRSYFQNRLS